MTIGRFKTSVVEVGESFAWLLFDIAERNLVESLCEYADYLVVDQKLSRLSVEQEMGYLRVFWAYLINRSIKVDEISGAILKDFREYAFSATKKAPAHRGSVESAKASTNAKLVRIYYWLFWMKNTKRVGPGLIGVKPCAVESALNVDVVHSRNISTSAKFPLLFRLKAGNNKHGLPNFRPDENTLDELTEYFQRAGHCAHVAHRNCLMASIASYTGFRRGSIQSLRVNQFNGNDYVETDRNSVLIRPFKQKFDYEDIYEIPIWLHEQVRQFICTYRSQAVKRCKAGARVHQNYVFISDRDGAPLSERAITKLMSKAMRALNAPKGTAIHVWRGKYATEETAEEYERRRELKMDTSILTMDSVIARKLGHKNLNSARPYTSEYEAAEVARLRAERDNERRADKKRILELEEKVRLLERGARKE